MSSSCTSPWSTRCCRLRRVSQQSLLHVLASRTHAYTQARFVTPIIHCNINSSGKVCHAVFDRSYSAETRVQTIFQCIYGLLLVPEPLDPLDSFVADLYLTQRCVRA